MLAPRTLSRRPETPARPAAPGVPDAPSQMQSLTVLTQDSRVRHLQSHGPEGAVPGRLRKRPLFQNLTSSQVLGPCLGSWSKMGRKSLKGDDGDDPFVT